MKSIIILYIILNFLFVSIVHAEGKEKIIIPNPDKINTKSALSLVEYIAKAYKALGYRVEHKKYPIERILKLFEGGGLDMLVASPKDLFPARIGQYVDTPILTLEFKRWCLKKMCKKVRNKKHADRMMGSILGFNLLRHIPQSEKTKETPVKSVEQMLSMLSMERVDFIYANDPNKYFSGNYDFELLDSFELKINLYHWVSRKNIKLIPKLKEYFLKKPLKTKPK